MGDTGLTLDEVRANDILNLETVLRSNLVEKQFKNPHEAMKYMGACHFKCMTKSGVMLVQGMDERMVDRLMEVNDVRVERRKQYK